MSDELSKSSLSSPAATTRTDCDSRHSLAKVHLAVTNRTCELQLASMDRRRESLDELSQQQTDP